MALTAGALSKVSVADVSDVLSSSPATQGTTPYTYQWYRSTTTGFSPGTATAISGATSLTLNDSGLTPGTTYYYKVLVVDAGSTTASATQLTVTTLSQIVNPNQFTLTPYLGMTDLKFNYNTISVVFDPAGTGTLVPGQAVTISTNSFGNMPCVIPSTAQADTVIGFVNYNIKNTTFNPGDRLEISQSGNVMYLYAAQAVTAWQQVLSLVSGLAGGCNGGVIPVTGSSGFPIVGYALNTAAIGQLVRVKIDSPSFRID